MDICNKHNSQYNVLLQDRAQLTDFLDFDTWRRQKSSLGLGSLLAMTLGVDRKAPWDEALC